MSFSVERKEDTAPHGCRTQSCDSSPWTFPTLPSLCFNILLGKVPPPKLVFLKVWSRNPLPENHLDLLDTTVDSQAPLQTHRIRIGGVVPRNSHRYTKSTGNSGAPQFKNPCFWSSWCFSSFPEKQVPTLSEHWSTPKESSLHTPRFLPSLEKRLGESLSVEEKSGY